jgi:hypothetical protein
MLLAELQLSKWASYIKQRRKEYVALVCEEVKKETVYC